MREGVVLEVIVSSVEDVLAAAEGGADRAEVVVRLDEDGLTPPRALVESMLAASPLPLRVMVRPANVFTVTDPAARAAIVDDASQFAGLPLDGVVTGYVTPEGDVDEMLLRDVAEASGQRVTYHRAFERVTGSRSAALAALRRVPAVDRVLCGGEGDDWASRAEALETLQRGAAPLIVVAGGGVDEAAASRLASGGVVREVHVGRTVRAGGLVEGVVEAEAVSRMVSRIAHAQSA